VTVDVGRIATVDQLLFRPSGARWPDSVRVWVSSDGREYREVPAGVSFADSVVSLARSPTLGRAVLRFEAQRARFIRIQGLDVEPMALEVPRGA
jgi:hypothetical protein